jgi:hypothetical protein
MLFGAEVVSDRPTANISTGLWRPLVAIADGLVGRVPNASVDRSDLFQFALADRHALLHRTAQFLCYGLRMIIEIAVATASCSSLRKVDQDAPI